MLSEDLCMPQQLKKIRINNINIQKILVYSQTDLGVSVPVIILKMSQGRIQILMYGGMKIIIASSFIKRMLL